MMTGRGAWTKKKKVEKMKWYLTTRAVYSATVATQGLKALAPTSRRLAEPAKLEAEVLHRSKQTVLVATLTAGRARRENGGRKLRQAVGSRKSER